MIKLKIDDYFTDDKLSFKKMSKINPYRNLKILYTEFWSCIHMRFLLTFKSLGWKSLCRKSIVIIYCKQIELSAHWWEQDNKSIFKEDWKRLHSPRRNLALSEWKARVVWLEIPLEAIYTVFERSFDRCTNSDRQVTS